MWTVSRWSQVLVVASVSPEIPPRFSHVSSTLGPILKTHFHSLMKCVMESYLTCFHVVFDEWSWLENSFIKALVSKSNLCHSHCLWFLHLLFHNVSLWSPGRQINFMWMVIKLWWDEMKRIQQRTKLNIHKQTSDQQRFDRMTSSSCLSTRINSHHFSSLLSPPQTTDVEPCLPSSGRFTANHIASS